jgi:hypothetical protein
LDQSPRDPLRVEKLKQAAASQNERNAELGGRR